MNGDMVLESVVYRLTFAYSFQRIGLIRCNLNRRRYFIWLAMHTNDEHGKSMSISYSQRQGKTSPFISPFHYALQRGKQYFRFLMKKSRAHEWFNAFVKYSQHLDWHKRLWQKLRLRITQTLRKNSVADFIFQTSRVSYFKKLCYIRRNM